MQCSINSTILTISLLLKLLSFCGFRALFLLLSQIKFPQWFVSFERQKMCAWVCLLVWVCVRVCMNSICLHICSQLFLCSCMCTCACYICFHVHHGSVAHIYVCVCVCLRTFVHLCVCLQALVSFYWRVCGPQIMKWLLPATCSVIYHIKSFQT